jgi:enoyl-CoA hydratase
MSTDPVVTTSVVDEHILVVTLDRPESRNAVNDEVARQVADAMDLLDGTPSLRVGVLTGAGRGFCAGLDLKAFLDGEVGEHPEYGFAGLTSRPPRKPLIAAVEGFALAGGLEIALACDLLVCAEDARLGIPEVRRGLVADGGALLRLPQRIPRNVAFEMALTGGEVAAARLHELGLVNRLVSTGQALTAALALASDIAGNSPAAVQVTKQVLQEAPTWPADEQWDRQRVVVEPVWTSTDAAEGARAFAEKRPPRFTDV